VFEDKMLWSYRILVGKSSGEKWVECQRMSEKLILRERVGQKTGVALGDGVVWLDLGCGVQGATK
jgi:hypothetical protein